MELLVDDTLAHKSGRQVTGAGVFRDAIRSTVKLIVYTWGLNLVVVCLRVAPPPDCQAVVRHRELAEYDRRQPDE